jgi:hypothetical protein
VNVCAKLPGDSAGSVFTFIATLTVWRFCAGHAANKKAGAACAAPALSPLESLKLILD